METMLRAISILLLTTILLAGCGGDNAKTSSSSKSTQTSTSTSTTTTDAQTGCEQVDQPKLKKISKKLKAPKKDLKDSKTYTATVKTNCGEFEIQLDLKTSPKTVSSFVQLADDGFYDDLTFHRVVKNFVIQGGDPKGKGTGDPGYKVTEAPPKDTKYLRGTVAMAKEPTEDPGTSGSQFFIVTAEDADLPAEYAVLGKIDEKGLETIDKIETVEVAGPDSSSPVAPIVIEKITIKKS